MSATIATWLPAPLSAEVAAALRRLADADDVARIAVMPDVHLAEDVCIGTVVATRSVLYPAAVGGDIGCGVATLKFDAAAALLDDPRLAASVLDGFTRRVPTLRHRDARALPGGELSHPSLRALARTTGARELGTLGRGNHFLELQADDKDRLWAMVHTGSRAIGQAIRDHHLRDATARGAGLRGFDADSPQGHAYLDDLTWALAYATANRRAILSAATDVLVECLGIVPVEASGIECHHNHVLREDHGEPLWVHRKGAISAGLDEPGLIPGSMGTTSYHVAGRGVAAALGSSSHGAGRRFSRSEARKRISARDLAAQLGAVWFDHRHADALRDEAPAAYKNVDAVMRAQRELTRVVRRVRPRLSYKGT